MNDSGAGARRVLFLDDQAESGELVQPFVDAWVDGTLEGAPVVEGEPELPDYGPDFELTSGQATTFENGVGAYNCNEPSSGTGGPLCVGAYTSGEYKYTLTLEGPTPPEEEIERMLVSMAPAGEPPPEPDPTASAEPTISETTDFGLSPDEETAEQYYYAVDYEAWETTYYNLDSESKALFTQEEWIEKNQWYADREGLELDSMSVDATMDGDEAADVTVYRTFTDGTSITRDTRFVWEGGYWRHSLTEEERDLFMPGTSYEEFVAAQ